MCWTVISLLQILLLSTLVTSTTAERLDHPALTNTRSAHPEITAPPDVRRTLERRAVFTCGYVSGNAGELGSSWPSYMGI